MATRMQQRRGTAAQWISTNSGNGPILNAGEIGYETDTNKFKIGDGTNHWINLDYFIDANSTVNPSFGSSITFEGATDNAFETTVSVTDPTADRTITLPDATGTVALTSDVTTHANLTEAHGATGAVVGTTNTQTLTNKTLTSPGLTGTPTAPTAAAGTATTQIATTAFVGTAVSNLVASAPGALDTLNELATALGNDASFSVTVTNALATKASQTALDLKANLASPTFTGTVSLDTGVNLVFEGATANAFETTLAVEDPTADRVLTLPDVTGTLATQDYATNAIGTHSSVTTSVHGIADTAALATKTYADTAVSTHSSDTTAVHGITDTSILVTTNGTQTLTNKTITSPSGLTKSDVGLGNVDNTTDANKPISTATQTALDLKLASATASSTYAPLANPTFTGTVSGVTKSHVGLANVDNTTDANKPVSTAQQTALDLKAPIANPTFTGTVSGVTKTHVGLANVDNTSDANKPVSTAQQTALDLKANLNAPTFTGTVSGITKTMVGLGNVDNTADSAKPVSTATQTALDAKLALAGGTMTGALTLSGAPTVDLHAATKAYVDNVVSGLNFHQPVRVATTANITLSGAQTIDGVSVVAGDRVLVKDQTTGTQNGIYVASASAWSRATDADNTPDGELKGGDFTLVLEGTVGSGYGYVCSNTSAITIGTTNVTYVAFNAAKAITAGSGLTESTPGTLDIATGGVTSTMILDGTIVDGDINASAAIAKTKISGTAITAADTGTVTSAMILDGTIVDGDINASAAIAQSKISGLSTSLGLKADLASPTFTGTVTIPAGASISGFAPLASPTFTGTNTVAALTVSGSGLITASSAGLAFTDGTQTKEGVPSRTPIIQKTASYALSALTERDSLIEVASSSATTITIPLNSAVAYPVGTSIDILQTSTGQVTIAGDAGVTVNSTPGLKLRTQWSSATLFKRATNTWVVYGDLTA